MKINEFDSIKHLINEYKFEAAFNEIMVIAIDNSLDDKLKNFVYKEYINGLIEEGANGWDTLDDIYYRTKNIKYMSDDIFYIDGYGNLRNITKQDLEILLDEVIESI